MDERAALDHVGQAFGLDATSAVVDLAAGTGQVSRGMRGRVGTVLAVEPSPAFRRHLAQHEPVHVVAGIAEVLPLRTAVADAVVVGTAFHWFDVAAAAAEIARVLTPTGGLALLWNTATWTEHDCPWLPELRALLAEPYRAAGRHAAGDGAWRGRLEETALFTPLEHTTTAHTST